MKKLFIEIGCLIFLFSFHLSSVAQTATPRTIAVFVPLYLDSAFDASGEYTYGKNFPKFLNPGLEFYEGVQLAADSLNKTGAALNVLIYDTRSSANPVSKILQRPEFARVELIIGFVMNNEIRILADIARKKNIPFINANIPNDGGVTNNASYIILNSTLRTHLQAMYKFLQKSYSTSPIVVFRTKGAQEDLLKNYFTDIERNTASVSLKLRYVTLNKDFTASQLLPYLDSTRVTMCIAGSLDEQFAKNLTRHLAAPKR